MQTGETQEIQRGVETGQFGLLQYLDKLGPQASQIGVKDNR